MIISASAQFISALKLYTDKNGIDPNYNCIYVEIRQHEKIFVATNGDVIAAYKENLEPDSNSETQSILIPISLFKDVQPGGILYIEKIDTLVKIHYKNNIREGHIYEGEYLPYKSVFPLETSNIPAQFSRKTLKILSKTSKILSPNFYEQQIFINHNGDGVSTVDFGCSHKFYAAVMPYNMNTSSEQPKWISGTEEVLP